eukprot:3702243-Alexandrium_andersonii.AAC.1
MLTRKRARAPAPRRPRVQHGSDAEKGLRVPTGMARGGPQGGAHVREFRTWELEETTTRLAAGQANNPARAAKFSHSSKHRGAGTYESDRGAPT